MCEATPPRASFARRASPPARTWKWERSASTGGSAASACGGGSFCEHGRQRSKCKECGGGRPVTFLEATEVEEFDGEEDPDECIPTVQARVVGGPRGGKRKR